MQDNRNIFIVRCGEVALKGLNKPYFERMLADRIKRALKKYEETEVKRSEGLIFVRTSKEYGTEQVAGDISRVFGVASVSPAVETASDMEEIGRAAVE
jgi:thiamine biosynthesis protein ThiI